MRTFLTILFSIFILSCGRKHDKQPPVSEVVEMTDTTAVIVVSPDSLSQDEIIVEEVPVSDVIEVPIPTPVGEVSIPLHEKLDAIYQSQIGVREKTGNNDGVEVEKYLRSVGLGKGYAWCSAYVKWCFDSAGVRTTITAWSPTAHNSKNVVYDNGKWRKELQPGDVFTLYYTSLKRIGHTGFVRRKFGVNSVETNEGNTNMAGSREGDGVYVKVRPISSLYTISRWL